MTETMSPSALARPSGSLPVRACAWGLGLSAALLLVVLASGLLPAGVTSFVWLGAGVAAVTGCAGTWLQTWLATTPKGHPQLTQRFVWGLVAPFLLQVAAVAVGCVVLVLLETKFEATAAFGLSFAAVATTLHTVGVMVVARAPAPGRHMRTLVAITRLLAVTTALLWLAAPAVAQGEGATGHGAAGQGERTLMEMENDEFFTPYFKHHLEPMTPGAHEVLPPGEATLTTFYSLNLFQVFVVLAIFLMFMLVRMSFTAEVTIPGVAWLVKVLRGWCHWLRDEVVYSLMGEEEGKKWAPLFIYIFFFIAFMNLVGLVPGSVTATACVFVTGALAALTFLIMVVGGMLQQGPIAFWKNLLPHGLPTALIPLMALVEVVGLFVKPFALMIRLFANMLAGHLLIMSFIGLIFVFAKMFDGNALLAWATAIPAVGMAVFINIIEALVVLLQAYIFTYLSVLFVQQSLHPEH